MALLLAFPRLRSLTAIFAKMGFAGHRFDFATFIRTLVILASAGFVSDLYRQMAGRKRVYGKKLDISWILSGSSPPGASCLPTSKPP